MSAPYASICRTLGHENRAAEWFWQPLHETGKAKDRWPSVTFKSVIVSNTPILKYIIFPFVHTVCKLATGLLPHVFGFFFFPKKSNSPNAALSLPHTCLLGVSGAIPGERSLSLTNT